MVKCNNCGNINDDNNKFCEYCGCKFEEPKIYCPKCKTKSSNKKAKFCGECGSELIGKTELGNIIQLEKEEELTNEEKRKNLINYLESQTNDEKAIEKITAKINNNTITTLLDLEVEIEMEYGLKKQLLSEVKTSKLPPKMKNEIKNKINNEEITTLEQLNLEIKQKQEENKIQLTMELKKTDLDLKRRTDIINKINNLHITTIAELRGEIRKILERDNQEMLLKKLESKSLTTYVKKQIENRIKCKQIKTESELNDVLKRMGFAEYHTVKKI